MSASLNGKRIVVLGGTSGIGLAAAKAAQREGAMIVVASSRRPRVDHALASLESGAEGHVVDLSGRQSRDRLFPATLVTDDPCVDDEMSLPAIAYSKIADNPAAQQMISRDPSRSARRGQLPDSRRQQFWEQQRDDGVRLPGYDLNDLTGSRRLVNSNI
jgi:NAD(P)-dependent dehydrogenase (short-subunit alcohol dehydrogenase family)